MERTALSQVVRAVYPAEPPPSWGGGGAMPPSTARMIEARVTDSVDTDSTYPPAMPRTLRTIPAVFSRRRIFWVNFSEIPVMAESSDADTGIRA